MLKLNIKASSITNLTDARYFAAWEVKWLGYQLDQGAENAIDVLRMKAIREWVDGVITVGEFSTVDTETIQKTAESLALTHVQVGMLLDSTALATLSDYNLLQEYIFEATSDWNAIDQQLAQAQSQVEAFVFNFDKNGLNWETIQRSPTQLAQLKAWCTRYPVILSIAFAPTALPQLLETLPLHGLNVQGGEEEKVGFKSYDDLDVIFETLEIEI